MKDAEFWRELEWCVRFGAKLTATKNAATPQVERRFQKLQDAGMTYEDWLRIHNQLMSRDAEYRKDSYAADEKQMEELCRNPPIFF